MELKTKTEMLETESRKYGSVPYLLRYKNICFCLYYEVPSIKITL